jgi:hypothetical protein
VVVVEPLVFVMMVSTTTVGVGVNCEVNFSLKTGFPFERKTQKKTKNEFTER